MLWEHFVFSLRLNCGLKAVAEGDRSLIYWWQWRCDDSWNVCKIKAASCVGGSSHWPLLGNLRSQLGHVTFMLHITSAYRVPHWALRLCNSFCQTANWISWCETDMIVSRVIQFQTNNEWLLMANQSGFIVPGSWVSLGAPAFWHYSDS